MQLRDPGLGAVLAMAVAVIALVLLIIGHLPPLVAGLFIGLALSRFLP